MDEFTPGRWSRAAERLADSASGGRRASRGRPSRTKVAVIAGAVFALIAAPAAIGVGEGDPLTGGERNPGAAQNQYLERETVIMGDIQRPATGTTGAYTTRQSNNSTTGGGAIYGCRSNPGGTAANSAPCLRANNLRQGLAFEFQSSQGNAVGVLQAGPNIQQVQSEAVPFVTNAAGRVANLNADMVDGLNATDLRTPLHWRAGAGDDPTTVEFPTGNLTLACTAGGDVQVTFTAGADNTFATTTGIDDNGDSFGDSSALGSGGTLDVIGGAGTDAGNGSLHTANQEQSLTVEHQFASDGDPTGATCLVSGFAVPNA